MSVLRTRRLVKRQEQGDRQFSVQTWTAFARKAIPIKAGGTAEDVVGQHRRQPKCLLARQTHCTAFSSSGFGSLPMNRPFTVRALVLVSMASLAG
jgi:hypothetical protein